MNKGILVISLDFEMMWGAKDWSSPEEYGKSNVAQVPQVIDRLLKLFIEYGIHATFATVGFLFCQNKEDLLNNIPLLKPSYNDENLSPYFSNYIENIPKEYEKLYFAPHLIKRISNTDGMEIATHTACHFNCTAPGQTPEEFNEDLRAAIKIANRVNHVLKSIVFPRNEVDEKYLSVCDQMGIKIFRGNALKYFGAPKNKIEWFKNRLGRLLDNYIPLDKNSTYSLSDVHDGKRYNVRASRFLRPYSHRLFFLERARLRRMKKELTKAAEAGEVYHIWWHPHNFGSNTDKNFEFLEKLLRHYMYCKEKYGMTSLNMKEVAQSIDNHNG